MANYYYKSTNRKRLVLRILSLFIILSGGSGLLFVFFPLLSWQIYFAPAFASQNITAPIPKSTVVNPATVSSLFATSLNSLSTDYTNAQTWFPHAKASSTQTTIPSYTIAIPKLKIEKAFVSTVDYDLSNHLINYGGTAIPPNTGTAVIFGHSTLPQLFNASDYKTIFANAYTLKNGDEIFATVANITYRYTIFSVTVVEATDTSIFSQQFDTSYITLVTCTPPGTTWKRLIIKARLEKL